MNSVKQLRQSCLEQSTRPFRARGSSVVRCPECMLAEFACICRWQQQRNSQIQFILVMHRKEVYKTTNSGRLLADMFPKQTLAFLWSRTSPDPGLLGHLNDTSREVRLLFPEDDETNHSSVEKCLTPNSKPLTLVLLDGTWKQATRMVRLSPWLSDLPRLSIQPEQTQDTYIRKATEEHQLSTAQAAAAVMSQFGEFKNSEFLRHYFSVFNHHCLATRRCIAPSRTASHEFLENALI